MNQVLILKRDGLKTIELKSCPFCGGEPELCIVGEDGYYYECSGCWCQTRYAETVVKAANLWNKRVENEKPKHIRKLIKHLEKLEKEIKTWSKWKQDIMGKAVIPQKQKDK